MASSTDRNGLLGDAEQVHVPYVTTDWTGNPAFRITDRNDGTTADRLREMKAANSGNASLVALIDALLDDGVAYLAPVSDDAEAGDRVEEFTTACGSLSVTAGVTFDDGHSDD